MIDFSLSNKLTDDIIINNDLLLVLQQIDLLFGTNINDVLGDDDFGSNYDDYLYTLGVSNIALEDKILDDLRKLDLFGFVPSVKVNILEGTQRDIALIDITLTDELGYTHDKTYMIK
jgi:hypothetical protein